MIRAQPSADKALSRTGAPPVDLADCDREPIQQLGIIQPGGFLIALSSDWNISRISANAPQWIGRPVAALLGTSLRDLVGSEAAHTIRNRLTMLRGENAIERAIGIDLFDRGQLFDVAVHLSGSRIILECEPSQDRDGAGSNTLVRAMIGRLQRTVGFTELCRGAARQLKALTGFDRVMVYKFHPDGSGEVVSEAARTGLASLLGLRYPASDIPRQARALYEKNWLRLIVDVDCEPVQILPLLDPDGEPLDLSMSMLRAVSPIHLEYLRNMGVAASMSVSILLQGKLWGLFACHHMAPRRIDFEQRMAAELFGQVFSLMLDSRERDLEVDYEAKARQLHNQVMAVVASESSAFDNVSRLIDMMTDLIPCDGIGVWVDEQATLSRSTPTRAEFLGLLQFLNRTAASSVYATSEIGRGHEPAHDFVERAAGLLAIPISRSPRDYIVFFRREVAHSVLWAGNPDKSVTLGSNGMRLTPRKSFTAWREIVRGQSTAWAASELRVAESLRITLLEVVLRLTDAAERERRNAAERQELLIAELNHRVRNILGLIHGLVAQSQSGAQSVESFASVLGGRVQALARAHDQITIQHWGPGALHALVAAEAAAYVASGSERVRRTGPDVLLQPTAFSTLALVVHELTTNSAKYGALSALHGHVDIAWRFDATGWLVMDWTEHGGPPVQAPSRRGFGTTIIERSVSHDLKGEAEMHYHLAGLRARLTIPPQFLIEGAASHPEAEPAAPAPAGQLSGDILLVEDNIIIALDAEDMLEKLGAAHVDIVGSVDEALRLIAVSLPSFAVLDINLGGETSFALASRLRPLGVPFCFATGYGEDAALPPEHAAVPVAKKPYSIETLAKAIAAVG